MPNARSDAKVAADNRLKRKAAGTGTKQTKKRATKDPNKPKRPPTAFFVFMSEFRVQFKKENPSNKSVAVVGKAGGSKWKSMSDAEKAPYIEKAGKKKQQYEKDMRAYNNNGVVEGKNPSDGESDKSKSEVNDDDDDDEEEEDEEDDEE